MNTTPTPPTANSRPAKIMPRVPIPVSAVPPVVPVDAMVPLVETANPLPQALILTAIVISFSFFTFLLVLAYRAYQELGTDAVDEMRLAEPAHEPPPPGGY